MFGKHYGHTNFISCFTDHRSKFINLKSYAHLINTWPISASAVFLLVDLVLILMAASLAYLSVPFCKRGGAIVQPLRVKVFFCLPAYLPTQIFGNSDP